MVKFIKKYFINIMLMISYVFLLLDTEWSNFTGIHLLTLCIASLTALLNIVYVIVSVIKDVRKNGK